MAAADDGEAVGVVDVASARQQGGVRLARIDQPRIDLVGRRRRAHADDAVFRMEQDLALGRHVVRHQGRDADAQIDQPAFGHVAR